jgi:hypothetical protein
MNSSEFDRRFEEGESVINALDLSAARLPGWSRGASTLISRFGWSSSSTWKHQAWG